MNKKLIVSFKSLSLAREIRDDDMTDQLHHFVMVSIFLMLSVFFTVKEVKNMPQVFCWIPAQYDKTPYRYYVNYYCWVNGLYNIPFEEEIPVDAEERYTEERSVLYYRWIVVIFLLQALMFKFPNLIWKLLRSRSGINVEKLLTMTREAQLFSEEKRTEKLIEIREFIFKWTEVYRRYETHSFISGASAICCIMGRKTGCYITRLFFFIKVLFLVNILLQFQILSSFLGFSFWNYGADVIRMLADGNWEDLKHFPRTALCDFELRQLQNIHRYTVQCSLPFNAFVEKVFAFEWFILVILSLWTMINLILYSVEQMFNRQKRFIRKYTLMMKIRKGSRERKLFKHFIKKCLKEDGIFILRIISNNASEVMALELLSVMLIRLYKSQEHGMDIIQNNYELNRLNKIIEKLMKTDEKSDQSSHNTESDLNKGQEIYP